MNFKKFNRILEEGGAYGHMANVHEDYTLQFEDLQNIIRQALTGGIQGTIKEKTDGQALAVGYSRLIVKLGIYSNINYGIAFISILAVLF